MKNLTMRYSITQFSYWAASTGATSFATTYLFKRGVSSGIVGTMLACAGILSCLTQPLLAAAADKSGKFIVAKIMTVMSVVCGSCVAAQAIPGLAVVPACILYMIGIWSSDVISPFLNALSVAYNGAGYHINYGAARGVGSAASAVSSLVLGIVIARFGTAWMVLFLLAFRIISIIAIAGYPKIEKHDPEAGKQDESCSVPAFFVRYKWYCLSLLGILFLGMYHAMTENYMIAIMERLGGNSSHVGTALFISAMTAAPVIFFFAQVRKRIKDTWLLRIAAVSFLLKSVLFCLAKSIAAIYVFQLLQITSYAFLAPTQVYYAGAKVRASDMVKGQAFIAAAYALGCSAGNFAGGQLLESGIKALLGAGVFMAAVGTAIIMLTVNKTDF